MRLIVFIILYFSILPLSLAQAPDDLETDQFINYVDSDFYELGAHMGTLLPFSIKGVDENYPLSGIFFSHPTRYGNLEYDFNVAKAKGVTWYEGLLSLRIDYSVYDFFNGYFRLGAQATRFQRSSSDATESDFENTFGSHFGFGSNFQLAGPYWARIDFKFGFGPGNTMNILAGLIYRWGSEDNK